MPTFKVAIGAPELSARMRDLLAGPSGAATVPSVVWQENSDRVLVHVNSCTVRLLDAWLLCGVDAQTDQTGRQTLQFVFFLGKEGEGDGLQASATINAATPQGAQLADRWGAHLQRVLWDTVLDAVEAALQQVGDQNRGQPLMLAGFYCSREAVHADILVGVANATN